MLMNEDIPPIHNSLYLVQIVYVRNHLGVMEKESISFSCFRSVFFPLSVSDSGGVWAVLLSANFVGKVHSGCRP